MRIYRSNPMDAAARGPNARGPLVVGAAAAVALGAFGVWADRKVTAERAAHVERAVAAQGLGAARAEVAKDPACGRGRRLYRWETPSAAGTACAGPRGHVEIRHVLRRRS